MRAIGLILGLFASLTVWISPAKAQDHAKSLHLGLINMFEDLDITQYRRLGAKLEAINPGAEITRVRNTPLRHSVKNAPFALCDLNTTLAARLAGTATQYDLVVLQATKSDFDYFWEQFEHGHLVLDALRGHLKPDGKLVFTGGAALGAYDPNVGGRAQFEGQIPALMAALGAPRAALLAALTPVYVAPSRREVASAARDAVIGSLLSGLGGTAITYIPREQIWIDFVVPAGALAWVIGSAVIKTFREGCSKDAVKREEMRFDQAVCKSQLLIGTGLTALVGGLMYSGSAILDHTFAAWAAGLTTLTALAFGYPAYRESINASHAAERTDLNQWRGFTVTDAGATRSEPVVNEDRVLGCNVALTGDQP